MGYPATQVDRLDILGDSGSIRLDGRNADLLRRLAGAAQTYDLAIEYQGSYNRTIAHFVGIAARQHAVRDRAAGQSRNAAAGRGLLSAVGLGGFAMKPQELPGEASALTREEEQAEVIRRLEEDIIFGRFAPGSRLVEDTLMTRYGASRHFVRQGAVPARTPGHRAAREEHRRHRAVLLGRGSAADLRGAGDADAAGGADDRAARARRA